MTVSIDELTAAIQDFDELADEALETRKTEKWSIQRKAFEDKEVYKIWENIDDHNLYDFIYFLEEGDPETGDREVELPAFGLVKWVEDNVGDTADLSAWLIFSIGDELFKIEGYLNAPIMFSAFAGVEWEFDRITKVQKKTRTVEVTEYE